MLAASVTVNSNGAKVRRRGVAAVEFAFCFPIMLLILFGMWEVGRITEVQNVSWNSAREGARDASMGQANLLAVANNLQIYLQGAEPGAFGKGHSTSMITPVVTLPANTYGYTCWDNTANQELFTMTFKDITNSSVTDPTGMSQLDVYELTIQVPYSTIGWLPVPQITGMTRLYTTVDWASLVDSPFQTVQSLPAQ
jgi:Flp pilus assembly protein TadG